MAINCGCQITRKHGAFFDVATIFFGSEATLDADSRESIDAFWAQVEGMVSDALSVGQSLGLVRASNREATAVAALGAIRAILGAEIQYYQDPERFRFEEAISTWLEQMLVGLGCSPRAAE